MRTVGQSNARRRARTLKPRGRRAKMHGGERKVLKDRHTTREEDHMECSLTSALPLVVHISEPILRRRVQECGERVKGNYRRLRGCPLAETETARAEGCRGGV